MNKSENGYQSDNQITVEMDCEDGLSLQAKISKERLRKVLRAENFDWLKLKSLENIQKRIKGE